MFAVVQFLIAALDLIYWLLLGRILLSWFPGLDWYSQPWLTLKQMTDPILEPFRRWVPPIGGFDFSPLIPIFLIHIMRQLLVSSAY